MGGALEDPVLELHGSDGKLIAENDNWRDTQEAEIKATGVPPAYDAEAAIVVTLLPGNYTAIVGGKSGTTGIASVEVYDLDSPSSPSRLVNISTRGRVETGEKVIIGGFILGADEGGAEILIRGIGPSLAQYGVPSPLEDPTLQLRDAQGGLILANDNWKDDSRQAARISSSGIAPSDDRESAIAVTLAPGLYTTILAGKNDGVGVGIVEVYNRSSTP